MLWKFTGFTNSTKVWFQTQGARALPVRDSPVFLSCGWCMYQGAALSPRQCISSSVWRCWVCLLLAWRQWLEWSSSFMSHFLEPYCVDILLECLRSLCSTVRSKPKVLGIMSKGGWLWSWRLSVFHTMNSKAQHIFDVANIFFLGLRLWRDGRTMKSMYEALGSCLSIRNIFS